MKQYILLTLLFTSFTFINAQDWSKVYRQVEEVTLNDGLEKDYEKFEGFGKQSNKSTLKKESLWAGLFGK